MEKGFKKCPFCANEIREKAIKCQYCGEFLNKKSKVTLKDENVDKSSDGENVDKKFDESKIRKSDGKDLTSDEKALKKAISRINTAFGWGCYSVVASLVAYILSITTSQSFFSMDVSLIDLIYGGVLVFFIYKRNRMAILFFFLYFLLSSVPSLLTDSFNGTSASIRIIECVFLFLGIIGSFNYHSLTNKKRLSISEIILLIVGVIFTALVVIGLFSML